MVAGVNQQNEIISQLLLQCLKAGLLRIGKVSREGSELGIEAQLPVIERINVCCVERQKSFSLFIQNLR